MPHHIIKALVHFDFAVRRFSGASTRKANPFMAKVPFVLVISKLPLRAQRLGANCLTSGLRAKGIERPSIPIASSQ